MTNAAFYFVPGAYDITSGPVILGRNAASQGFLRGFVRHSGQDQFHCHAPSAKETELFHQQIKGFRRRPLSVRGIAHHLPGGLSDPGCLYFPAPDIGPHAWTRRGVGQRLYSITGVTHTICSHRVVDEIGAMLWAPLQPWDAVICTSRLVRDTALEILATMADYLQDRLGARPLCPVQMPVIPLGVDCAELEATPKNRAAGRRLRQTHDIADGDVVVLYAGRLSFHAKAHPLPLFRAMESAARETGTPLHLMLFGLFPNQGVAAEFRAAAREFCPSVKLILADGRGDPVAGGVWHAADLFVSLADNIQESFGLTVIEAQAAGLAVIASDWNGYRETVRDGIDGLLVPTLMAPPGQGADIALRHAVGADDYDRYVGHVSQFSAVDTGAVSKALVHLIRQPALRQRMGGAGRAHALACFDWAHVVRAYQGLWAELAERRKSAEEIAPLRHGAPPAPLRDDPFRTFRRHASMRFGDDLRFLAIAGAAEVDRVLARPSMAFAGDFLLPADDLKTLAAAAAEPATAAALAALLAPARQATAARSLVWLVKAGILGVEIV